MIATIALVSSLLVASASGSHGSSCTRHCSHSTHTVCGTDGKNYKNLCYLNCEALHNVHLAVHHNGSCTSIDTYTNYNCDKICDDEGQQEYCANDGVTYESMCDLQNAACLASTNHQHYVTAVHPGKCLTLGGGCAFYNASCPSTTDYKCGSTGYTYRNGCYLQKAACQQKAAGSASPVTLLHDGKCGYASTNHSRNVNCTEYADMSLAGVAIEGLSVRISAHCSHYHNSICVDGITYSSDCYVCYKYAQSGKITYQNLLIPISHDGSCHYQTIIG